MADSRGEPILEALGLQRRYDGRLALEGLDLSLQAGQIYGLVGPDGAGKTTALRLLAGLLEPDAGRIHILGRLAEGPRDQEALRQAIGYLPADCGLYPGMSCREILDFYARCHGLPRIRRRRMVEGLLELVGLDDRADAEAAKLARAPRRRLCLAQALVHDPPILLLDEPGAGLDARSRAELAGLLAGLRGFGKAILLASHRVSELTRICDHLGLLQRGRLLPDADLKRIERGLSEGEEAS